ncbi:DUF2510 domain-containing protein [Luteococcus sp. OSA5]|uniref:DUF2510 domain-containing protein n=1 Tax=Luteococcus sp. OSA5 TaxID=3401630 RepID=UPI003B433641
MTQPVAGWYPDPLGAAPLRWWDGSAWSGHVTTPLRTRLAHWIERVRAYLLDAMPLWLVSLVLFDSWHQPFLNELVGILRVSYMTQGGQLPGLQDWWSYGLVQMWFITALPGVGLRVCYDVITMVWKGGTLGKLNGQLRVAPQGVWQDPTRWSPDHGLPWQRALVRSLVHRLLAITGIGFLVCVLWPLADPARRSLADLLAGTQVVSVGDTAHWAS